MHTAPNPAMHDSSQQKVVIWADLRQSRTADNGAMQDMLLMWDKERAFTSICDDIPFDDKQSARSMFDSLVLYTRGSFEEAYATVGHLMEHADPVISLTARLIHLRAALMLGYPDTAYDDSAALKNACEEGITQKDNRRLYASSIMCGTFLEYILRASLFDLPETSWYAEEIPLKLRANHFYIFALKEILRGNYELAQGMAYMSRSFVSNNLPHTHEFIYLSTAVSCVALGEVDPAKDAFMKAWGIYKKHGVISPFLEAYTEYFGLHRACIKQEEPEEYAQLEASVNRYRKSVNDLCQRWGSQARIPALSSSELSVWMLVALGWRNKEIAAYLHVTENTVKHQLTSIYQKMGIGSRRELRQRAQACAHS